MNPITNSAIKEQMRQRNLQIANQQIAGINQTLNYDLSQLHYKDISVRPFVVVGIIVGIIAWIYFEAFLAFLIAFLICLGIWSVFFFKNSLYNDSLDEKKQQLKEGASSAIAQAYQDADQRTLQEIAIYEKAVQVYSNKILNNASSMIDMVNHVVDMFQRMISHADNRSHMKFIEGTLIYTVQYDGIVFTYPSSYTNKLNDYNFNVARYRDLCKPEECEGLAQALARLTIQKMKTLYPKNSMSISVAHMDSQVTLVFKGANPNFVPSRKIV